MAEQNNDPNTEMAEVMNRNIREIIKLRQDEEKEKTSDEHIADKITSFTGRMSFVYIHLVLFALYIAWNAGLTPIKPIDPNFTGLGTVASVEAIFLSTFVLIRQNRMNKLEDKRANLNLQVSLLAEHEATRLLTLVSAIGRKLNIEEAENPEFDDLKKEVTPEKVLDTMDKHKKDIVKENGIEY
ncbi:MAG: hypothetical protein JWR18_3360 [Segetibacter sp.]|jgi:uncharacterized membrane protein|nr:hypothetical protein [Segetibacter sp.]